MKLSRAKKLRGMIEFLAEFLSDDEAVEVTELFASWDSAATYDEDTRVRHKGVLYRCLQRHTAQPTSTHRLEIAAVTPTPSKARSVQPRTDQP